MAQDRAGPIKAEPGEIVEDLCLPFRAAAGVVEIINAQVEGAACGLGHVMGKTRGIGVAQMQGAGGRWGEARGKYHDFSMI